MEENLLAAARGAQERLIDAERDAEVARADFHQAVRRLHLHGASLRELAAGLGLSHQRIHQIVESAGGSRRWVRRREGERSLPEFACTFCGRGHPKVKVIAGPGVYICNLCVGVAERVISGTEIGTFGGPIIATPEGDQLVRCSFCGKSRHQVDGIVAFPVVPAERTLAGRPLAGATVCTECLELCDEIISERLPDEEPA
jgi:hypothetical protein